MRLFLVFFITKSAWACTVFSGGGGSLFNQPFVNNMTTPIPMMSDYEDEFDNIDMNLTKIHPLPEPSLLDAVAGLSRTTTIPPTPLQVQAKPVFHRDSAINSWEADSKKWFSPMLDWFKPVPLPALPPVKNFFDYSSFKLFPEATKISSPMMNRFDFVMDLAPPVSWTFCEPTCGSGDQAVDAESAVDNAHHDIKEAMAIAFQQAHLTPPRDDEVTLKYHPNSTLMEDFGNYFGTDEYRYRAHANTVYYKMHKSSPHLTVPFHVMVTASVKYPQMITSNTARRVASKMTHFLASAKFVRLYGDISVRNNDQRMF